MWLALIVTHLCNFRCKTCLRDYGKIQNLSLEKVDEALRESRKYGFTGVSLTGGEPALHPEFKKIVELAVKNRMYFGFVSNGSMLDKYKFVLDYRNNLSFAAFSVDGSTAEVHDYVREKGSFKKVKESVKFFVDNGVRTNITTCLNKLNKHQMEDIVKLGTELGVTNVSFTAAIKTDLNKDIVLTEKERIECTDELYRLQRMYKVNIVRLSALCANEGVNFCAVLQNNSDIAINPKGEMSFCCDTIGDGAVVGSLQDESFAELYSKAIEVSENLKKARIKMISKGERPLGFNTCEFCNHMLKDKIKKKQEEISSKDKIKTKSLQAPQKKTDAKKSKLESLL